ncbi:MAG: Trk family potassium uptake protein [Clostridia bacterium]|nr:Trk family potassium uptake protein [Clostridia bacterium]
MAKNKVLLLVLIFPLKLIHYNEGIRKIIFFGLGSHVALRFFLNKKDKKILKTLNPPRYLALGFLVFIFIGTLLLSLPLCWNEGYRVSFIDALFTATSAVCISGLMVVDPGNTFNIYGQLVILFLIQLGGLGFMTAGVLVAMLVGRKISLRHKLILQESLNQFSMQDLISVASRVALTAFVIELLGSIVLGIVWFKYFGLRSLYLGIFHAVSAFNNAGITLFGNFRSLSPFTEMPVILFTFMALIVLGGIGFTVIWDLLLYFKNRKLLLHSKVVVAVTTILLLMGTVAALLLEGFNEATLGSLSWGDKIINAMFFSVTSRTAGFSTLNVGSFSDAFLFFLIILMFIGASPGSTGGGVKTTTAAVLLAAVWSDIKGQKDAVIFKRSIPPEKVARAMVIVFVTLFLILFCTIILCMTERASFLEILFEVVSAFGTTGLSTGLTPKLSLLGKIVIIFSMFVGRLGPLSLAFALRKRGKNLYEYPKGFINLG